MVKKNQNKKPAIKVSVQPVIRKRGNKQPKRKRIPRSMPGVGACTLEYAKSVVDPFNFSSCIPDGARGTGVFSVRQNSNLYTGTGTCYGIMVQPWVDAFSLTDYASSSSTPTVAATWSNAISNGTIRNMYESARPVSLGIKLTYTGSTLNDQGLIVLAQMATNVFPSGFSAGLASITQQAMWYKIVPLREGATISWRPTQELDTQYKSLTGATPSTSGAATFPYLVAYVFGAKVDGDSSVQYQISATFEGRYHDQNFLPGGVSTMSTEKEPDSNWYEYGTALWNKVSPFAPSPERIASTAGSFLGGYLGMKNGPFLGNGMPRIRNLSQSLLT